MTDARRIARIAALELRLNEVMATAKTGNDEKFRAAIAKATDLQRQIRYLRLMGNSPWIA